MERASRSGSRRAEGRRRPALLAGLAVWSSLVAACVTTSRRPLPEFDPKKLGEPTQTTVQVFDPAGKAVTEPVAVGSVPVRVGRLRPSPWAAASAQTQDRKDGEAAQEPKAGAEVTDAPQGQEPIGAEDLYARFGPHIIIHPDHRVTKTYYVDSDTGTVLDQLLTLASGAQPKPNVPQTYEFGKDPTKPQSILDSLLGGHNIVIQRIQGFDQMKAIQLNPRAFVGTIPAPTPTINNDLVLVTSKPDGLEAFEQTMDMFYRSVPQILIEAKVVEIAWGDVLDIGVSQVDDKTPTLQTIGKGSFVRSIISKFPNSSLQTTGTGISSEGLLTIGGIHDNLELNAQLELLQSKVKSDIVSHPKIAVRNGGVAVIDTTTSVPYPEAKIIGNNTQTSIKFIKVGVSMQIRPMVVPGETVVLQIYASVDAITGFADTDPIPTPEVSTRKAVTSVNVPSGKTTVIGGLISKNRFENEAMIPLLGDIPLLGYLFRSTFIQEGYSEVVFMITPRIIYGFEGAEIDEDYLGGGF